MLLEVHERNPVVSNFKARQIFRASRRTTAPCVGWREASSFNSPTLHGIECRTFQFHNTACTSKYRAGARCELEPNIPWQPEESNDAGEMNLHVVRTQKGECMFSGKVHEQMKQQVQKTRVLGTARARSQRPMPGAWLEHRLSRGML